MRKALCINIEDPYGKHHHPAPDDCLDGMPIRQEAVWVSVIKLLSLLSLSLLTTLVLANV